MKPPTSCSIWIIAYLYICKYNAYVYHCISIKIPIICYFPILDDQTTRVVLSCHHFPSFPKADGFRLRETTPNQRGMSNWPSCVAVSTSMPAAGEAKRIQKVWNSLRPQCLSIWTFKREQSPNSMVFLITDDHCHLSLPEDSFRVQFHLTSESVNITNYRGRIPAYRGYFHGYTQLHPQVPEISGDTDWMILC